MRRGLLPLLALALAAGSPAWAEPVDLAKAYAPADLALLLGILAKAGVPESLDVGARQAPDGLFASCGPGAREAFIRNVDARLVTEADPLRRVMAGGFQPPLTHDELLTLDRLYQLTPIFLAPSADVAPASKPLSPVEQAEADALAATPTANRYLEGLKAGVTPTMEHVALIFTAALHKTCSGGVNARSPE